MYSKQYILNIIRELEIYNIRLFENDYKIDLEIGLTKPPKVEPLGSKPQVKNTIHVSGNELTICPSKVDLEFEVPQSTIDIIKEKSDILTKDLEECNETPISTNDKTLDIVLKKKVKVGEPVYPSDFKLEHITKPKRRKDKGKSKHVSNRKKKIDAIDIRRSIE